MSRASISILGSKEKGVVETKSSAVRWSPTAASFSPTGDGVIVADSFNSSVWNIDLNDSSKASLLMKKPSFGENITGVVPAEDGNVFLSSADWLCKWEHRGLYRITPADTPSLQISGKGGYVQTAKALPSIPQTLEAWVRMPPTVADSSRGGIIIGSYPETNNWNMEVHQNGVPRLWWNNGQIDMRVAGQDLRNDTWTHIVFVREMGLVHGRIHFYRDGKLIETKTGPGVPGEDLQTTGPLRVGTDMRPDGMPFRGCIKRVRLWGRPLSAEEVAQAHTDAPTLDQSNVLLHYEFADPEIAATRVVHDRSPNHNDGTMVVKDGYPLMTSADSKHLGVHRDEYEPGEARRLTLLSGITASAKDGTLFIADRNAHAVLTLPRGGKISFLSGKTGEFEIRDGDVSKAAFKYVNAIAWNPHDECVYVAEGGLLRKITKDGSVSSVPFKQGVTSLTVHPREPIIFFSTKTAIGTYRGGSIEMILGQEAEHNYSKQKGVESDLAQFSNIRSIAASPAEDALLVCDDGCVKLVLWSSA